MWNFKETPPALILAVFVLLFCTNVTVAQTADEGKIREFANTLLSAKTESEQSALLAAAEPGLITVGLVQELKKQYETFNKNRELSKALVALKLMRKIAEQIGDEKNAAFAIVNMGVNYYSRGEFQQASELFEHYLSLEPSKRDPGMTARALNNAGMIKRTYGDNAGALDYVQRSQRLAEEVGDKKMLGSALNNLGVIYRDYGEYARALEYFEKSLAMGEALGDKPLISLAVNNIGTIHGTQGDQIQALEYFQRALKLAQAADDKNLIAYALNNIGLTYHRHKEYPRALEYYQQSLALREQLKDQRGAALTLNNIDAWTAGQSHPDVLVSDVRPNSRRSE